MAHLLNLEAVSLALGTKTVLDGVSLGLDDGDRVGVVGRNGGGKTTLLQVMAKVRAPDSGRVTHSRGLSVGLLRQGDDLDDAATVREAVVGDVAEHTWAADAAVRDIVGGLLGGLAGEGLVGGLGAVVGQLSGGQRRRVSLAALLARPHDVVLLDEPTNHLDVEGVAWLAEHLPRRWAAGRGALVLVTHDRWFLDAVATSTWEVRDGVVDSYDGGYAAYVLARAERSRATASTQARRQNLLRKELAWLRRGAPARTSKPRFRLDAAAALIADEPAPRDSLALQRMSTARLGKDVLDLEDVSLAVGGGEDRRALLDHATWRLGPGERIGLVGVNGSGKTTLLRLLLGTAIPDSGRVKRGKTVQAVMLTQDVAELDEVAHLRVAEAVEKVRGVVRIGDRDVTAGQLLERFGFARDRVWTLVGELSGGERRRLQLLRLLMTEPNVLLLDEPTNDLDTETLAAIEDTLDGWPGTLVVVSHDRYLLERTCDREVALLGDGTIRDLPGGVEEYLRLRAQALAEPSERAALPERGDGSAAAAQTVAASPGQQTHQTAQAPSAADVRAARKDMGRLERRLDRLTAEEERLHTELAASATDHWTVLALDARLRELAAERERLEEAWLEAADLGS